MGHRSEAVLFGLSMSLACAFLGCGSDRSTDSVDTAAPSTTYDIGAEIVEGLRAGTVTTEELQAYFGSQQAILSENLSQAEARHGVQGIAALVDVLRPRYLEDREAIVDAHDSFPEIRDQIAARFGEFFGTDLPAVRLYPVIGLYANGGWASQGNIAIALERVPRDYIGALLAHEWAHAVADQPYGRVCDQIYREGFATYVSMMAAPGHPEEAYFQLPRSIYESYLVWIGENRERILGDLTEPVPVGGAQHSFYFSTSRSEMPNIGYVIGYLYLQDLSQTRSLSELRSFGTTEQMLVGLQAFVANY